MWILSCCMYGICRFIVTRLQQCTLSDILHNRISYVHVNKLYNLICCCLSGWASGTGHWRPQGADGEAGEGGTGAMGVWWYGLTGQPPTACHSCRPPAAPILLPVHRRPWHKHKRGQPCVRTWPAEEYSTLARKLSTGNFPAAVQVTEDVGPFLQKKIRYHFLTYFKGGDQIKRTSPQIFKCTESEWGPPLRHLKVVT